MPQETKLTFSDNLRVWTGGIIDPIVTVLARLHVSPDSLTILGMLLHILYAWLIVSGYLLAAGITVMVFVPLDALDGALARKLGKSTGNFGAFLDSTSDRVAEIILFAGFIYYFSSRNDVWLTLAAYAALTGSLMVSYARARAESLGLSCKVGLLTRMERYVIIVASLVFGFPQWGVVFLAVGTYFTLGQRIYHVWRQSKQIADAEDAQR